MCITANNDVMATITFLLRTVILRVFTIEDTREGWAMDGLANPDVRKGRSPAPPSWPPSLCPRS